MSLADLSGWTVKTMWEYTSKEIPRNSQKTIKTLSEILQINFSFDILSESKEISKDSICK